MKTQQTPDRHATSPFSSDPLPWHSRLAEAALVTYFPYSLLAIISGIILGLLGLFTAPLYLSADLTSWLMLIPETLIFGGLGGIALIPVSIGLDSYLSYERHNDIDESSSDEYDDNDFCWDDNSDDDEAISSDISENSNDSNYSESNPSTLDIEEY